MPSRRQFLKTGLGLAAAAELSPGVTFARMSLAACLRAGAGRADVILKGLYPLDDFVGEHDPLSVRVVLLENGSQRQAIAILDLTSITAEVITRMKAILAEIAGVPTPQAVIGASHSFSTPHVGLGKKLHATDGTHNVSAARNDAALSAFETAMRSATQRAVATLQPARLGAGSGYSRIGVNRNVDTPYGWWVGADDTGFSDPHVGVVRVDSRDGTPLAVLMNYAVQPAVMDASQLAAGGRLVSADLAGAAARHVEAHYGGNVVALYLVGAAGDQVPYLQASRHVVHAGGSVGRIDIHEAGFTLVDLFGQRLGNEVIRVADGISAEAMSKLDLRRQSIPVTGLAFSPRHAPTGPVRTFDYTVSGPTMMPIVLMQWGEVALVGVQPEFSATIGAHIRAASPYAHTLVVTMADGAAKYLPDVSNYDRYTYEARSSPYARGAAEMAADAIVGQLKQMKRFVS